MVYFYEWKLCLLEEEDDARMMMGGGEQRGGPLHPLGHVMASGLSFQLTLSHMWPQLDVDYSSSG